MVMRNYNGIITKEIVQQFLPHPLALYSVVMSGDITTSSILFTTRDPVCSYYETIEIDNIAEACTKYLIEAGVPVFREANSERDYLAALETQLRAGTVPEQARANALREVGLSD